MRSSKKNSIGLTIDTVEIVRQKVADRADQPDPVRYRLHRLDRITGRREVVVVVGEQAGIEDDEQEAGHGEDVRCDPSGKQLHRRNGRVTVQLGSNAQTRSDSTEFTNSESSP